MLLIDTSEIITNPRQLLDSRYEFCFYGDDDFLRIIKEMPNTNILKLLIEKYKDCVVDVTVLNQRLDLTNRAFFINPAYIRAILSLYVEEKPNVNYWMSEPIFFDSQMIYYYRTELTESQINSINDFATNKLERSLFNYVFDFPFIELAGKNVNLRIFSDLNEFIEEFTVFSGITLRSLRMCFGVLVFCELLVFFLFLCSKALGHRKRR